MVVLKECGSGLRNRLTGGEISAPCLPPVSKIRAQRDALITSGEIDLGQPCVPFTLTRWIVNNGEVKQHDIEVSGRKISLLSLRTKLLKAHEEFMHLETDSKVQTKSRADVISQLQQVHEPIETSLLISYEISSNPSRGHAHYCFGMTMLLCWGLGT